MTDTTALAGPATLEVGSSTRWPTPRVIAAEFAGSLLLTTVVVGSGIAAQRLSPNDVGLQLAENAASTAAGLYALILIFAPISGAHFNPAVSLAATALGQLRWRHALAYLPAQITGCVSGALLANIMFASPASISTTSRATLPHGIAEIVATAGLLLVIFSLTRTNRSQYAAAAVGAYIGAAYFFTSSTSFANPAITIGRVFTGTFAGIAPTSVPMYAICQLIGTAAAVIVVRALYPTRT